MLRCAAPYSSVCPSASGRARVFGGFAGFGFFHHSPTHRLEVLSCFGLFFCRLLFIVLACTMTGFVLMRTNFLEAAVVEESLESRHVRFFWNSLQCSVITFIVSVFTAPRRAPRTGRMLLLIPLDPPLSVLSCLFSQKISSGFRLDQSPCFGVGVCPFSFL